jgi:putative acetyltransferase
MTSVSVRPETSADRAAVWNVNHASFARDDEARLVDALRDGGYARVALVAEQDGFIVGHVLFSDLPIATESGIVDALALAPLAVVPSHQRRGIGSTLLAEGLRVCKDQGHRIVVVLGHPEFYPRFGFSAPLAERLTSPFTGPEFMALELVPKALDGVVGTVCYAPPFDMF